MLVRTADSTEKAFRWNRLFEKTLIRLKKFGLNCVAKLAFSLAKQVRRDGRVRKGKFVVKNAKTKGQLAFSE